MNWFVLLRMIVSLVIKLFDYVEREKLMSAGEARALLVQLEELNVRVKKAVEARDSVARDSNAGKLRDDDGYKLPEDR